jgi:hypothetical protein
MTESENIFLTSFSHRNDNEKTKVVERIIPNKNGRKEI